MKKNTQTSNWLENYNDSEVSLPQGFVGEGIFNGPKFDSPAWGGQFQMGGNLPGAVGNMYARTGSPSKGPRRNQTDVTDASAQNGKEMQYYQQGLDWKPKTISQDGSKLDYHTGDKVTYGTPEYREAYNRGEVITDKGVHSPIQLDEVVIKGKKKDKNWLEQYASKIAEENRDAGVLGAIIGTPISAVASLPQLAMMKLFTDKMQRPSEAIGFENNEGLFESPSSFGKHASNFVLDAVTDPANLIGAGVLTKENALAKLAASKESGLLSNTYKYNPYAERLNDVNKSYRVAGLDSYDDFLNSGVVRSGTSKPKPLTIQEMMEQRPTSFPSFQKGFADTRYLPENGGVIYETNLPTFKRGQINPVTGEKIRGRHYAHRAIDPITGKVITEIPAKDIKVLGGKPHWLQGYKEVPKQEDGGIIKDDRGQWAKNKKNSLSLQSNWLSKFE